MAAPHPAGRVGNGDGTHRAAVVSNALTMVGSMEAFLSCWRKDGLWKATHAGNVFEMTRSPSCINSGVSL